MYAASPNRFHRLFEQLKWYYFDSLKGRLIALSLGLSLALLWGLVFLATSFEQQKFKALVLDEQLASARRRAVAIAGELQERVDMLTLSAAYLPDDLTPRILDDHLRRLAALHLAFTSGIVVISLDGRVRADYPVLPGRRNLDVGDRDYFQNVIQTGKPAIVTLIKTRTRQRPSLVIAVPVLDRAGNVRAILTGATDLSAPGFLSNVLERKLAGNGNYYVVSPHHRLILASNDPARVLGATPAPGQNAVYDRFAAGFEGSTIGRDTRGILTIFSSIAIPMTNWFVTATYPVEMAFRTVTVMRHYVIAMAVILTAMAVFGAHWLTRRLLAPLEKASQEMQRMTQEGPSRARLELNDKGEIGIIISNFNALMEERHRSESELARSEQRFRSLFENAPDAIYVCNRSSVAYANAAALQLFGAQSLDQVTGHSILGLVHPDSHGLVEFSLQSVIEAKEAVGPGEVRLQRLDGTEVYVRVSVIPFDYQNAPAALAFARDITERKRAEQALRESHARIRKLAAHQETIKENERKRIARDLHDELGQTLLAIRLDAVTLAENKVDAHSGDHKTAHLMLNHIDTAMKSVKAVINDLRPFVLDLGLVAAMEWQLHEFQRRSGIECVLEVDDEDVDCQLDEHCASALFRALQESLTNIVRHARASHAHITIRGEASRLRITIADDGVGIAMNQRRKAGSFGLIGIEERMQSIGGTFAVDSAPGKGTTLILSIPLPVSVDVLD